MGVLGGFNVNSIYKIICSMNFFEELERVLQKHF